MLHSVGGGRRRQLIGPDEPSPDLRLDRATLARIGAYFRPYWLPSLGVLVCILVGALVGLLPPLLVRALIDEAIPRGDHAQLALLSLGMILAPAAAGLLQVAQTYLNTLVGQRVMLDLRNESYERLIAMPLRFFTATRTGEIMSRLTNDISGIQNVVTNTVVQLLTNTLTILTTLVLIFALDWRLSLLAVAILPLFVLPTRRVGQIRRDLQRATQAKLADLNALMQETLSVSGVLLVKTFAREDDERRRFRQRSGELMALQMRANMVGRWFFMVLGLFGAIGPALVYWYGGYLAIEGALSVGTIVAFVAFLGRLYQPLNALVNWNVEAIASLALFERIFQYLDLRPEIADRPGARPLPPIEGRITFDHVGFSYIPGRPALHDITFEAQPGQIVALVGPSGAGKTTITYLVPRLYDVTEGRVLIDGHDVRDVTRASLAAQIGVVTQETYLFHASVAENLRYARPDATDAELEAACRAAHIHDLIASLPEGYRTKVGERGYRLSGGEKQRLAIARVILKNPRILILDEATSSLDSTSEALIQQALDELMRGRTSLVIAHRLSTIRAADLILVVDGGRIVERGTHAELLAVGGLYTRLYEQQFRPRPRPLPLALADDAAALTAAPVELLPAEEVAQPFSDDVADLA